MEWYELQVVCFEILNMTINLLPSSLSTTSLDPEDLVWISISGILDQYCGTLALALAPNRSRALFRTELARLADLVKGRPHRFINSSITNNEEEMNRRVRHEDVTFGKVLVSTITNNSSKIGFSGFGQSFFRTELARHFGSGELLTPQVYNQLHYKQWTEKIMNRRYGKYVMGTCTW